MAEPVTFAYALPWWMQWAQAVGIGIISGAGVFIAWKQSRIASAKLNLDLYEKRFAVFDAARKFLREFTLEGKATLDMLNDLTLGTGEAVFLFEDDVKDYLEHVRKQIIALRSLAVSLKSAQNNDQRRGEIADRMALIETELMDAYPKLVDVFKPYLKLGNI